MLRKVASNIPIEETRPRVIGVLRLPNGAVVHTPRKPRPQRITGMEEGDIRGIDFGWWEDDGSPEFDEAYARMKEAAESRGQEGRRLGPHGRITDPSARRTVSHAPP